MNMKADAAYHYARCVREDCTRYEQAIMKDARVASRYARFVIKGRWPEAEPYIMQDPWVAYEYAKFVIKGRWPEAEPYIIKDRLAACHYAKEVIKGKWVYRLESL